MKFYTSFDKENCLMDDRIYYCNLVFLKIVIRNNSKTIINPLINWNNPKVMIYI